MRFSALLVSAAVFATIGVGQELRPHTWTHIAESKGGDNTEVALARTRDGVLHIFWIAKHGTFDLMHGTFSEGQQVGASSPVVTGWMAMNSPAAVVARDGRPMLFLSGIRSLDTREVFSGKIATVTGNAEGKAWQLSEGAVTSTGSSGASPLAATVAPDGTPIVSWFTTGALDVHIGFDPKSPDRNLQTACCAYNPNLATDTETGEVVIIWYSNASKSNGLLTESIAPQQEEMRYLPESATEDRNSSLQPVQRIGLTARLGAPGVFSAYCIGYPSCTGINLWRHNPPQALSIARVKNGRLVNIAAAPDGRLWAMWLENGTVHATRSNRAATRFGPVLSLKQPNGADSPRYLKGNGDTGPLDVVYGVAGSPDQFNIWLTRVLPPFTLTSSVTSFPAAAGASVQLQATDVGDPLEGVVIHAAGQTATTDAAGQATIVFPKGTPAGGVIVSAARPGYANGSITVNALATAVR